LGILLDLQVPVMSGWQVMDQLKEDSRTRHIPVHMMSSYSARNKSLSKGAVDFIDKPFAYEQLHDVLEKIEFVLQRKAKKVLIIEDNPKHAKALSYFLESFNISSELKSDIESGLQSLESKETDCVILDMGIPDKKAYEMLERFKADDRYSSVPVIIFTGKSLSMTEEAKIRQYADSIVVKTAHSYQRMLDEVALFLHLMGDPIKKQRQATSAGALEDVLKGKTVLVADDDVRNIFSLSRALERYGVNVVTAINGQEAIEQLEQNSGIDLVLLDIMMPVMDGYEVARKLRADRRWKNLPVIAVTAKAMSGDREKCISAGASDYITKPVDIDQLISLLRVWLYERT
jgi:CheY-like chemotaxis protein